MNAIKNFRLEEPMRLPNRRHLKLSTLVVSFLYLCVLMCHSVLIRDHIYNELSKPKVTDDLVNPITVKRWQDRPPRSLAGLNGDYDSGLNEIDSSPLLAKIIQSTTTSRPSTDLSNIFISVKTTGPFHRTRLDVLLKTWYVLAKDQIHFFTDTDDEEFQRRTNNKLYNTNCSSSHNRKALCCKMSVELDSFLDSDKRWMCHFDDDNYVNVPNLVKMLQNYDPQEDWYLGKPSIKTPLEIMNRDNIKQKISFWFATGGAGFCISRALALKMMPLASGGKFISVGEKIRLPDDVTMGYIIEHLLNKQLTVIEEFHSHLEPMKFLKPETFTDQISFSYSNYGSEMNVINIEGFNTDEDPTRFLSLHCYLFPTFSFCPS